MLDEAGLIETLKKLKEDSAPGPDGVPAILLRRCAITLARTLLELWRRSFEAEMVPEALKEGIVWRRRLLELPTSCTDLSRGEVF